jgi:hypothetical protein
MPLPAGQDFELATTEFAPVRSGRSAANGRASRASRSATTVARDQLCVAGDGCVMGACTIGAGVGGAAVGAESLPSEPFAAATPSPIFEPA